MKTAKAVPTVLELELLNVIWERGQATVREVYQDLLKKRKIAYTTVLTMMGVLEHKGHLRKTAGERAYIYVPTQPRGEVVERMVDEFVGRVFNGAAKPLLVHLVGDRKIRPEDLDEIEKLVQARKKKQSWRSSR
ncbi:MAG: BlaI/MecI/CopY family transcriptional regulator [Acidobacteriia bacterium]|nr:BlaI/MecI/CopY family transcriptional regulator [Terriglobia bacterium]